MKRLVLGAALAAGLAADLAAEEAASAAPWGSLGGEPLVPAALGMWTDQTGATWNLQEDGTLGRVGSGMMNVGQALWVGGTAFSCAEPLMTRSGREWVFPADRLLAGLSVTRRVRLDLDGGTIRYLEVLRNVSAAEITVGVELRHQYNGNHAEIRTDRGRLSPLALQEEETGVVVVPASESHPRRMLHRLREAGTGPLLPVITAPSRYAMHVRYEVRIPPGRTVSLWHGMAQPLSSPADGGGPGGPDWSGWADDVGEPGVGDVVTLDSLGAEGTPWARFVRERIEEEATRPTVDTWWPDGDSWLRGKLEGGPVVLRTSRGRREIPAEEIVEITGTGGGRRDVVRVRTGNGEIHAGTWDAGPPLWFRPGAGSEGGDPVSLDGGTFERVVRAKESGRGLVAGSESVAGMLETQDGERILAGAWTGPDPVAFASALGTWQGRWTDIAAFRWDDGSPWLELRDGSRWRAFPEAEAWEFRRSSGEAVRVEPREVRRWIGRDESAPPAAGPVEVRLRDGARMTGKWAEPDLGFRLATGSMTVGGDRVRRVARVTASGDIWVTLDDGGRFRAKPERAVVALLVTGGTLTVPWEEVREIRADAADWSEDERRDVQEEVARLGAESWEERERASAALGQRGGRIRGLLEAALADAEDPEIRHRLHLLLDHGPSQD